MQYLGIIIFEVAAEGLRDFNVSFRRAAKISAGYFLTDRQKSRNSMQLRSTTSSPRVVDLICLQAELTAVSCAICHGGRTVGFQSSKPNKTAWHQAVRPLLSKRFITVTYTLKRYALCHAVFCRRMLYAAYSYIKTISYFFLPLPADLMVSHYFF